MEEYIVFDIDGVLANPEKRLEACSSLEERSKEWWECFLDPERMAGDTLIPEGLELMRELKTHSPGAKVVLLSSRPESTREVTEKWLRGVGVEYDILLLKPKYWRTVEYKRAALEALSRRGRVLVFVDDDERNIEAAPPDIPVILFQRSGATEPASRGKQTVEA